MVSLIDNPLVLIALFNKISIMKNYFFLLFFALFVFSNCDEDKDEVVVVDVVGDCANCLNFNSLEVGQQSKYLGFIGDERNQVDPATTYSDDTLVVSVVGLDGTKYLIQEHLSHSPDSSWQYEISLTNDLVTFHFPPSPTNPDYPNHSSALVLVYSWELIFELSKEVSSGNTGAMNGWEYVFDEFCSESPCYGTIDNYSQLGDDYPMANVYQDYSPMAWDGAGQFMIYNNDYGVIRSVSVGSWVPKGWGWDLIMD